MLADNYLSLNRYQEMPIISPRRSTPSPLLGVKADFDSGNAELDFANRLWKGKVHNPLLSLSSLVFLFRSGLVLMFPEE